LGAVEADIRQLLEEFPLAQTTPTELELTFYQL
jgi:hypothetical protein